MIEDKNAFYFAVTAKSEPLIPSSLSTTTTPAWAQGFKPSGGTVQELNFRSAVNVWGYFSVHAAGGIHEYAVGCLLNRVQLLPSGRYGRSSFLALLLLLFYL